MLYFVLDENGEKFLWSCSESEDGAVRIWLAQYDKIPHSAVEVKLVQRAWRKAKRNGYSVQGFAESTAGGDVQVRWASFTPKGEVSCVAEKKRDAKIRSFAYAGEFSDAELVREFDRDCVKEGWKIRRVVISW